MDRISNLYVFIFRDSIIIYLLIFLKRALAFFILFTNDFAVVVFSLRSGIKSFKCRHSESGKWWRLSLHWHSLNCAAVQFSLRSQPPLSCPSIMCLVLQTQNQYLAGGVVKHCMFVSQVFCQSADKQTVEQMVNPVWICFFLLVTQGCLDRSILLLAHEPAYCQTLLHTVHNKGSSSANSVSLFVLP